MDELAFYTLITGEWECTSYGLMLGFKYDGFRMYKRELGEWVESPNWSLVRLSENSDLVTGLRFEFFNLPDMLLKNSPEQATSLVFYTLSAIVEIYVFKRLDILTKQEGV